MKKYLFFFLITLFVVNLSAKIHSDIIDWEVMKYRYILEKTYELSADSVNIEKATNSAYNAFLNSINQDSKYFSKEIMQKLMNRENNVEFGIGLDFVVIKDTAIVLEDKTGKLSRGDKIIKIDNTDITGYDYRNILNIINGEPDTDIIVESISFDNRETEKNIFTRKDYPYDAIQNIFNFNSTGTYYIKYDRFSEESAMELKEKLDSINSFSRIEYLILDLRNNPGGLMEEVVDAFGLFVKDSSLVTEVKSNSEEFAGKYFTKVDGEYLDLPVTVLIDSTSKSGSEMLAAAFQEHDRGITIGSVTYGKGSVQKGFPMKDSTAFRLTVAYYYTPLGRRIEIPHRDDKEVIVTGNIPDNLKSKIQKMQNSEINYVKTKGNRVYFETGGISPDYEVRNDTLTLLTRMLIQKGLFFKSAMDYIRNNEENLMRFESYKNFAKDFKLSEEELKQFAEFCISENVWNKSMFEKDITNIMINIKASIAYLLWGKDAYHYQLMNYDKLVIEAIRKFQVSKELLN
jgi:carboxyl-terminal processing protease